MWEHFQNNVIYLQSIKADNIVRVDYTFSILLSDFDLYNIVITLK